MRNFVAFVGLCVLAVANVDAVTKETLNLYPLVDFTEAYNRHEEIQKLSGMSSDRTIGGLHQGNPHTSGNQNKPVGPGAPSRPPPGNPQKPGIPNLPNYPHTEYPNYPYPILYPNYQQNPGYPSAPGYPNYSLPGYPYYVPPQWYPTPCYCQPKMK